MIMKETYYQMKERHRKTIDKLPLKFAFNNKQFREAMESLGLKETDTDKVVSIGAGGFCTPETAEKLNNICKKQHDELTEAMKDDNFLQDAFEYELGNHEYIITWDVTYVLLALNIKPKEYIKNDRYIRIMKKAKENYLNEMKKFGY